MPRLAFAHLPAALLLIALLVAGCGKLGHGAETDAEKGADAESLNAALAQELTALDVYTRGMPMIGRRFAPSVRRLRAQEQEFVSAISKAIRGLGGEATATAAESTSARPRNQGDVLALAYELESAALASDIEASPRLFSDAPRTLAASLAAGHSQHLVILRQGLGAPPAESFPKAFDGGEVPPPGGDPPPGEDDLRVTGPLYAIGHFCSRHHWPTIAVWLVLAIGLVVVGQSVESRTNDNLTLPGTDSTAATELLEDNIPQQAYGNNPLVIRSSDGKLTEPKLSAAVGKTVKQLGGMKDVISAISPLSPQGAPSSARTRRSATSRSISASDPEN